MEKQYRLKKECKKWYKDMFSDWVLDSVVEIEDWDDYGFPIEALEEVKPKFEITQFSNESFNDFEHYLKLNKPTNIEQRESVEFMLNDLLPYGVEDIFSLDILCKDYALYLELSESRLGFTDWLKQK